MREVAISSIELSHPITPLALNIYVDFDCNPDGCHVVLSSQPPSSHFVDPPDCIVFCSSILYFSCDVHKDQVLDKVGVEQPICIIIFYEYVWESKEERSVKDDLLLFAPHSLFPDIFCDSAISILSCENSFPNVPTSNHSQDA